MKYKIITMNKFYQNLKFPTRDIYGSYLSSDFSPIPGFYDCIQSRCSLLFSYGIFGS